MLWDKQIKALANHLNLTMAHVSRHETMLYELDSKLMILNKTLQSMIVQLSYFRYENNLVDNMQMHISHLYTAIYALKEDIDALYEYMRVLSTQQLNPLMKQPHGHMSTKWAPPPITRGIQHDGGITGGVPIT